MVVNSRDGACRGIIAENPPAKSPGARSGARPEEAWSLRVWQRVSLNPRALALLL